MRIGELSRRTGASVRSLRYYEEQGLLLPTRRPSGYREFDESDVDAVAHIRTLLDAGLPTRTIALVLPCLAAHAGESLALSCSDLVGELRAERDSMRAKITHLEASVAAIDRVIEASPQPSA